MQLAQSSTIRRPDSHVSRTDVSSAKIYRRSAPIGSVAEHGLYFLAFARHIGRFDLLLRRMFGRATAATWGSAARADRENRP